MKTLLAILGSPRPHGNCELAAKVIARQLPQTHNLVLLRLPEFRLAPCRGCYRCLTKGRCPIEDDHTAVLEAILAADALLVVAPTYFLGPNGSLKRFTDRGLALYPHLEALWGKPALAVGIAGIPGKEGYTLLGIENFLSMLFAERKAGAMLYGALPGEIMADERNQKRMRSLAAALGAAPYPQEDVPTCPLCGGCTFRFLDRNRLRCMLCSNEGPLVTADGKLQPQIGRSDHELFLTREEALAHRDWLLSMKTRFKAQKEDLKRVGSAYRRDGRWIKPARETAS